MSGEKKLKWLLAGAGDIAAKRVAPALVLSGELVAVCDVARERAERTAAAFDVPEIYDDLEAALAGSSAEAVYVATPVHLHARQAVRALETGRHVLVEKPLGISAADAAPAVEAARTRDLRAGCAYFRRCSPRYSHAKRMVRAGEFGRITFVRMTYSSWFNPAPDDPKRWRVIPSRSGGGVLADVGSHMFDVFIGLFGMPARAFAKARTLVQPYEAEDSAAVFMELPDGTPAVAGFSWNSKAWAHEFEIVGTEARVKWSPYDAGKVIRTAGREVEELDLPNAENVHLPLVEDFSLAVRRGGDPAVPLAEALRTNVLLDAVYESSRRGKEIEL